MGLDNLGKMVWGSKFWENDKGSIKVVGDQNSGKWRVFIKVIGVLRKW